MMPGMPPQPSDLERSILHTVCWFAVHGYPVTAFEAWKWLWFPVRTYHLEEVVSTLAGSAWLVERLQTDGAFYALRGQESVAELVARREERFTDAVRKYAKLRRAARYLALLPTVEAVSAGNTLAWWHTREDSDIDLLILTRPGFTWLTRAFAVLPFALLGRRPGAAVRDPFCFSFFASSDQLSLRHLQLFGGDPYLAFWTRSLVPVLDRGGAQARFQAANGWCAEMLPHAAPHLAHPALHRRAAARRVPTFVARLERFARRLQEERLPERLRARANRDSSVVISDSMLKFHENDRREAFRDRFQELVTTYER